MRNFITRNKTKFYHPAECGISKKFFSPAVQRNVLSILSLRVTALGGNSPVWEKSFQLPDNKNGRGKLKELIKGALYL